MHKKLILLLVLASTVLSGCYIGFDVEQNEVGAIFNENALESCVGAGRYSDWTRMWSSMNKYSIATHTFEVHDEEVATKDNQLVGVTITIQAVRKGDCESIKSFFSNWSHLLYDEKLIEVIDANAREGIKNGTRSFTLNQLLDDRNGLSRAIISHLEEDASKYNVDIINVTIENVSIDSRYAEVLQETAQLNAQQEQALRRQSLIEQQAETDKFQIEQSILIAERQLSLEQAQTLVEVEIARREGEIVAAAQQVYELNDKAFQLALLDRLALVFNDKTVYFVPQGSDLTTLFGLGNIVPYGSQ